MHDVLAKTTKQLRSHHSIADCVTYRRRKVCDATIIAIWYTIFAKLTRSAATSCCDTLSCCIGGATGVDAAIGDSVDAAKSDRLGVCRLADAPPT